LLKTFNDNHGLLFVALFFALGVIVGGPFLLDALSVDDRPIYNEPHINTIIEQQIMKRIVCVAELDLEEKCAERTGARPSHFN
jgi:hypothetical protein